MRKTQRTVNIHQPIEKHELKDLEHRLLTIAKESGLEPFPTIFELIDFEDMNEIVSYSGFPSRYPHWRFGMEFETIKKSYTYGLHKIYELVINNDPCYAYLLKSNSRIEQKIVIAHVYGHSDFFRNNAWYAPTNRKMLNEMANHGQRIKKYMDRYGIDPVEEFIDTVLSVEHMIDYHSMYTPDRPERRSFDDEDETTQIVHKLPTPKGYMDKFINPPEFLAKQKKKLEEEKQKKKRFPERPARDVLNFLVEYAPLENWQKDIICMISAESYYFAPQRLTKIMNEGWACVVADTPVFTERGLIDMKDLVAGEANVVSDGDCKRGVYDQNMIRDHETIRIRTRRGLELEGSTNHRVLLSDGRTWKRLDELKTGDRVRVAGGAGMWPDRLVELTWTAPDRVSSQSAADSAGVSLSTVLRYRQGRRIREEHLVDAAVAASDSPEHQTLTLAHNKRVPVKMPRTVDEMLAEFVGYLVGDGHSSKVQGHIGLTSGERSKAKRFVGLARQLFATSGKVYRDGKRWCAVLSSETVSDFLTSGLGLTWGPSARQKAIPTAILRSPEPVVRAFLRALFDCDGHAGKQGVLLSTSSDRLARQVQLLLLNYGILSRRRHQQDGCQHVHVAGRSAAMFAEKVGFGLRRKQAALERYVRERHWFKEETWDDEIVGIWTGKGDVYDISVEETHRYAAAGFVNHNSYWHSKVLSRALEPEEIVDYADINAGVLGGGAAMNPYKLGVEIWRDIEDRWNKGRFGKEWEECDDYRKKQDWDLKLGLGMEKIFEVRRVHNDLTFLDNFMTPEFVERHKMFLYKYNPQRGAYEIASRDYKAIKATMLFKMTNMGFPVIDVIDGNFHNRGEMLLKHQHEGFDLEVDEGKDVLKSLFKLWGRPVNLWTVVEGQHKLITFDGSEHKETNISEKGP